MVIDKVSFWRTEQKNKKITFQSSSSSPSSSSSCCLKLCWPPRLLSFTRLPRSASDLPSICQIRFRLIYSILVTFSELDKNDIYKKKTFIFIVHLGLRNEDFFFKWKKHLDEENQWFKCFLFSLPDPQLCIVFELEYKHTFPSQFFIIAWISCALPLRHIFIAYLLIKRSEGWLAIGEASVRNSFRLADCCVHSCGHAVGSVVVPSRWLVKANRRRCCSPVSGATEIP